MRKIILSILMFLIVLNIAQAGFFVASEGGTKNNGGGFWTIVRGIFGAGEEYVPTYKCSMELIYTPNSTCSGEENETQTVFVFDANWQTCCNITGLSSDCFMDDTVNYNTTYVQELPCGELNMYQVAISILTLGSMFFLIYVAGKINTQNKLGNEMPINNLIKIGLYVFAFFMLFINIQMAYGISIAASAPGTIDANLMALYQYGTWFFIIIGGIIMLGLVWNSIMVVYNSIQNLFKRKVR